MIPHAPNSLLVCYTSKITNPKYKIKNSSSMGMKQNENSAAINKNKYKSVIMGVWQSLIVCLLVCHVINT